jgi:hypothetical protein
MIISVLRPILYLQYFWLHEKILAITDNAWSLQEYNIHIFKIYMSKQNQLFLVITFVMSKLVL